MRRFPLIPVKIRLKTFVLKILNALEPPDKNPRYFLWKMTVRNLTGMTLVLLFTIPLLFVLPQYPSNWRGLYAINVGFLALSTGYVLKYIFYTFGKIKATRKIYEFLMNEPYDSENITIMILVFLCQILFWGSLFFGIFLLLSDLLGFNGDVQDY